MNAKLQKYLESYKRLYFKGEIQNAKTKSLLDKKRISLDLSEDEVEVVTKDLLKKYNLVTEYVADILDLNYDEVASDFKLDDFDREEIEEFWRDMDLSDEEGGRCLEFAINNARKGNLNIGENTIVEKKSINDSAQTVTIVQKKQKPINIINDATNEFNVESKGLMSSRGQGVSRGESSKETVLGRYKNIISVTKENIVDCMQMRFLNLAISYAISYETEIFKLEERKDLNENVLKDLFYICYEDFIEEFMLGIKEHGIIPVHEIPNFTLDEMFEVENIKKYTNFLDDINNELDNGANDEFAWMPKVAIQYESGKVNAIIGRKTSDYIFRVLQECKTKKMYEGNIANKAFRTVELLLVQMIANSTSHAMCLIKSLIDSKIDGVAKDLAVLIKGKEDAINYITSAKAVNKNADYERYIGLVLDALVAYPHYEEVHLEIINIVEPQGEDEKILLDIAYGIIMVAGEGCSKINKMLIELNSKLYNSSLERLTVDSDFMERRALCESLRKRFKISDINTIVRCELQTFGQVVSTINYGDVEESLRLELYKNDIISLKNRDIELEEKAEAARGLRNLYKIEDDKVVIDIEVNNFGMIFSDVDFLKVDYEIRKSMFKTRIEELEYERDQDLLEEKIIEYKGVYRIDTKFAMKLEIAKFGRWFGELDLTGLEDEELEEFVKKLSKTIMLLNLTTEKKGILLNQLKEESGYSTKYFYELQNKIGNTELALNNEDSIDIEFIGKANELYRKFPKMVLEEKILTQKDKDFNCGVFIKDFAEIREELRDEALFILRKPNNREGFLITSKAIYHSSWTEALLLKDIAKIIWKEKSVLKAGQRYFRPYIHLVTAEAEEFRFEFVGFRQIDVFIKFLMDLINTYKTLRGQEICDYQKISIADSSLSVYEMLEGNTYMDKFAGEDDDFEDIKTVYDFVKKNISSELKKHIKLQDMDKRLDGKIKNAIAAYAPIEQNEVPLIAFDSTLFKSGKEGFLLTTKGIYCKNKFGTPWKVSHKEMKFIKLEQEAIIFNDKQTTISSIPDEERFEFRDLLEFCSFVFKNQ